MIIEASKVQIVLIKKQGLIKVIRIFPKGTQQYMTRIINLQEWEKTILQELHLIDSLHVL